MITLIKQKSDNKIKALARVYRAYKKRGWDISRIDLSRHRAEIYRNNLQLIVFLDYVKNGLCVKLARGKYGLPDKNGVAVNYKRFFEGAR